MLLRSFDHINHHKYLVVIRVCGLHSTLITLSHVSTLAQSPVLQGIGELVEELIAVSPHPHSKLKICFDGVGSE